ncbi:retrovirus-related Pol polyprotein from transposon opus [Trichonephila clavipes]|nr:retrovirus-related Pol polyprotein from transposon opus [Trichonephila clavipes]
MSALDFWSGYFQMAVNPSDIIKTSFVTKNGTYAFRRMPFGLSGAAPNFQKEGIKTDETKVQAIVEIKPPHNSKEVSKFLGMSQWYAKFIKNYADICEPLYNLKRKLKRFIWSIEAQKAFDAVKAAITKAPVLKFPDFKKPFKLFTDASSIGVGAVLNQGQRPLVYASRTLSAAERNYTVTERECLAVVWALNKFRTYLGSFRSVITDHAALTHLTTDKNLSNRMIKWALKAEFNIKWEHRPGTQNTIADVLSRNPIESIIGEKVNCAIIRDLVLSSRDQLIEEQKTDPELGHIYRYLEHPEDSSVNVAISDHFSKWAEIIPLKKASARVIADNFFDNYVSRFGAPMKLISDNGPQFLSDIFENLSERLGIKHVKTVVYRPQANRTERVNRDLVQMIANYVNEQHDTWDQFLREFAYAIRTAVNKTTGKTPAELFLGRKLITPFQKLVMVSDGMEFAVGDIERLFDEARRNTKTKHEKWEKYYNRRRRDVQIKVNDWVLVATYPLSSATRKVVAKFKPKFKGPYRVLNVKNNNVVIWKAGKRLTINVNQVRIYRHRKCEGTGSSDNNSLRDESSDFDRVQRRSNESRDGKKKGKKSRREETVAPTTSGYNLRPRIGKRKESRPTIERKTHQGGPVQSRKGRERNDSPYIEERTRSSNKNAKRGGDQQRQDQERRGTCTKKSLSLEVLVGNANYKS